VSFISYALFNLLKKHVRVPQALGQGRHRQPREVKDAEGLATDDAIQVYLFQGLQILVVHAGKGCVGELGPDGPHQMVVDTITKQDLRSQRALYLIPLPSAGRQPKQLIAVVV